MNGIFKAKMYGAVTVGGRGQLVIPAELRKALRIKAGDKLMVFAKLDKKTISMMPEEDFTDFLRRASNLISKLENEMPRKRAKAQ
jgi:AbrB family looped-hinge helix DNA binding protein